MPNTSNIRDRIWFPTGTSSAFDLYVGTSTHVIIDINGIFLNDLSSTADQFAITTNISGAAAVLGQNNSSVNGSHGVGGYESGTGLVYATMAIALATGGLIVAGLRVPTVLVGASRQSL